MYPIKHSYASFTNGLLFERKIETYTLEELEELFDIYNVKWIVCWDDASKRVLNHMPEYIHSLGQIDKFTIYEVKRNPTFFIKGNGSVKSDYNMLWLDNITPEKEEIIISYHWLGTLRAIPAVEIEGCLIGNDPVGFIKVKSPPDELRIYNQY
jgi:hypothetical protein